MAKDNPLVSDEDRALIRSRVQKEVQGRRFPKKKPKPTLVVGDFPVGPVLPSELPRELLPVRHGGSQGKQADMVHRGSAEVTYGRLTLWMKAFARWLVVQPRPPKVMEQLVKVKELAPTLRLTPHNLKKLKDRADFKEYRAKIEGDELARARAQLTDDLPEYVERHRWAADAAQASGDYKAMASLTVPALDRIWPKHAEASGPSGIVVIQLGERRTFQQTYLEQPPDGLVEVEVLPPDLPPAA